MQPVPPPQTNPSSGPTGHQAAPSHRRAPRRAKPQGQADKKTFSSAVWAFWGGALALTLVASGIAVWQVDDRLYSTQTAAENYWEALRAGDGSAALGMFSTLPEAGAASQSLAFAAADEEDGTEDAEESTDQEEAPAEPGEDRLELGSVDSVLLDDDALRHSTEQIEGLTVVERSDGADLSFTVDGEEHEAHVPMSRAENIWFFFDDWRLDPEALTEIDVSVPAAELGGIGQVDVNGEPINLHEDSATLAAFVPSVVDITIDSQWLSGATDEVIAEDGSHQVELELEASETAAQLLHDEVQEYLDSCADQQVLMPAGCPMGVETPNRVDADTISWEMPDPEDITLAFGEDGWTVSDASTLTATATFESLDHFDGDELVESEDVSFGLDIQVGASGEDLLISVTGD